MFETVFKVAGEKHPFLQCTKATFERLGRVIVKYGVKVNSVMSFGDTSHRSTSFVVMLEIPLKNLQEVADELGVPLTEPEVVTICNYQGEKK
jgi:hypothetical protein